MDSTNTPEKKSAVAPYRRLRRGSYFADFRCNEGQNPAVYHCIIQCDGSGFIISWTQHRTLEDAIREAKEEPLLFLHALKKSMGLAPSLWFIRQKSSDATTEVSGSSGRFSASCY